MSIHFNSGAHDEKGNGRTTGTEVWIVPNSRAAKYASRVEKEIAGLGFKSRGVKTTKDLYILNHTKAPAMLVECCFADDADDAKLYNKTKMANAIVKGIIGE